MFNGNHKKMKGSFKRMLDPCKSSGTNSIRAFALKSTSAVHYYHLEVM